MKKLFGYAIDIGEQMLVCGAEVHRVEECVSRTCRALGAVRTDVFTITSSLVVTVHMPDGESFTETRRVTTANIDFERLHYLNNLSREICDGKLAEQEIGERVRAAEDCQKFPLWLEIFCYAVIAGAFALFFGGDAVESAIAFVIGGVVRISAFFAEKIIQNKIFGKFLASVITTLLAFLAVRACLVSTVDKVIIGNIMTLIPGIGLTNAIRDLFTGDSIAGLLRSIEAVLTALAIAAGYFLVALLGGLAV